jgi:hypothetical protein
MKYNRQVKIDTRCPKSIFLILKSSITLYNSVFPSFYRNISSENVVSEEGLNNNILKN